MRKDAHRGDDPYEVLGVHVAASREDIGRAYHRAARVSHPDAQPADPEAANRFRALTEAYDLLSDADRRADYDRRRARETPPDPPHRAKSAAGTWPLPQLRAGPVHVEPVTAQPRSEVWHRPADLAEACYLLERYLEQIWSWPR